MELELIRRANGIDTREVDPNAIYDTKSVGNSTTLPYDIIEMKDIETTFLKLSEKVAERLEAKNLCGSTITIQIRDCHWKNQSKSKTVQNPIYLEKDIFREAMELFSKAWDGTPIRLLGVTVSNVIDKKHFAEQLSIFNFEQFAKEEPIYEIIHSMEKKFGKGIVQKGIDVKKKSYASKTSFSKDFFDDLIDK